MDPDKPHSGTIVPNPRGLRPRVPEGVHRTLSQHEGCIQEIGLRAHQVPPLLLGEDEKAKEDPDAELKLLTGGCPTRGRSKGGADHLPPDRFEPGLNRGPGNADRVQLPNPSTSPLAS